MSSRYFEQNVNNAEKGLTVLLAKALITGGTGVVASFTGKHVASFARTGAGDYLITLQDKFVSLVGVHAQILSATAQDLVPQIVAETVSTNKTIRVKTLAVAAATDAAQDCALFVTLYLKNSSV